MSPLRASHSIPSPLPWMLLSRQVKSKPQLLRRISIPPLSAQCLVQRTRNTCVSSQIQARQRQQQQQQQQPFQPRRNTTLASSPAANTNTPSPPPTATVSETPVSTSTSTSTSTSNPIATTAEKGSETEPLILFTPQTARAHTTSSAPLSSQSSSAVVAAAAAPPLSPSLLQTLPLLHLQSSPSNPSNASLYATIHIHSRPYLVTLGDRVRLPFLMPSVQPGDVLRLTRASTLGTRDYTLRGEPWVDERVFEVRATVGSVESEPMRIMKKTKRRVRKVKSVRSKHRYTELLVSELRVRSLGEILGDEIEG